MGLHQIYLIYLPEIGNLPKYSRPALQRYLFPLTKSQDQEDEKLEFPLLHPQSNIKLAWNSVFVFMMLYVATILPFRS
jgi:hyperpolarization activated cyclic nucleotide-gated potassium channel 1